MPLIREGVSPGKPGKYSQTPPSGEACNGHEGVVKFSTDETTSTLTNQLTTAAKYRSGGPRGIRARECRATPTSIICLPQPCVRAGVSPPHYLSHFHIQIIYTPFPQNLNSSTSTPTAASPSRPHLKSSCCSNHHLHLPPVPPPQNMPTTDL